MERGVLRKELAVIGEFVGGRAGRCCTWKSLPEREGACIALYAGLAVGLPGSGQARRRGKDRDVAPGRNRQRARAISPSTGC